MNDRLIDASSFYLFRYEERIERANEFLNSRGFAIVEEPNSLVGKVLATSVGTFHCDFMAYPVDALTRTSNGYDIGQKNDSVIFGNQNGSDVDFVQRQGLDLFVPDYFFDLGVVFVGDKIPEGTRVDDESIGWKYPPKKYISEEELKSHSPELYNAIIKKIQRTRLDLDAIKDELTGIAEQKGIPVDIETRLKTPVGVYSQLQRGIKGRNVGNVYDINGVRILPATPSDCYAMLAAIDEKFLPIDVFRDLIAVPKPNGYQSIIAHPQNWNLSLEIQLQTPRMKEVAEQGSAANYRVNGAR